MFEDTIEVIRSRKQTIQWPKEKGQTPIYKTLHRKLKTDQHEPHKQPGVNSGAPDGWAVKFIKYQNIILLYISIDIDTLSNCLF